MKKIITLVLIAVAFAMATDYYEVFDTKVNELKGCKNYGIEGSIFTKRGIVYQIVYNCNNGYIQIYECNDSIIEINVTKINKNKETFTYQLVKAFSKDDNGFYDNYDYEYRDENQILIERYSVEVLTDSIDFKKIYINVRNKFRK